MCYIYGQKFASLNSRLTPLRSPHPRFQGAEEAIIQIRNIYNFTIYITLNHYILPFTLRRGADHDMPQNEEEFLLLISIDNDFEFLFFILLDISP